MTSLPLHHPPEEAEHHFLEMGHYRHRRHQLRVNPSVLRGLWVIRLHPYLQEEEGSHPSHHPHGTSPTQEALLETVFLLHHPLDAPALCHLHPTRGRLHRDEAHPHAQVLYHLHPLEEEEAEECLPPYLLLIVPVDPADPLYPQTLPGCPASLLHPPTPSMATRVLQHLPQMSGG